MRMCPHRLGVNAHDPLHRTDGNWSYVIWIYQMTSGENRAHVYDECGCMISAPCAVVGNPSDLRILIDKDSIKSRPIHLIE